MNKRKWNRISGRNQILLVAVVFFSGFLDAGIARPTDDESGRICNIGNVSIPEEIFQIYAGWECFEETFENAGNLDIFICTEKFRNTRYSVPCFKAGRKKLFFNLKNEETIKEIQGKFGSSRLNDEMIRCYLSLVMACEASPDGWLGRVNKFRFFLFNITEVCTLEGQNKFHIAMLSISMIVGIPSALIFFFCHRFTEIPVLSCCRDLIIVLLARTFFTLIIEANIVSNMIESREEELEDWAGCKALASLETITSNLTNAFWLILTFYLLEYSKSGLDKEPDIRKGKYVVLGLSFLLSVVWIIIMAVGGYGKCWLERSPVQWVNDSLRIGFLIIQIILIFLVIYRVFMDEEWIKDKEHLRKISCTTMVLSPLFLLQFSLNASHPHSAENSDAHTYTEYFFDGLQCGLVSLSYLFLNEVRQFILKTFGLETLHQCNVVLETAPHTEVSLDSRRKETLAEPESRRDITYSSVLTPERFEKTINLYNRLNIIPKHESAIEINRHDNSSVKSEYFDLENDFEKIIEEDIAKYFERVPVKNKLYNSRYLVQDSDSSVSEEEVKKEKLEHFRKENSKAVEKGFEISESERRNHKIKAPESVATNVKGPMRRSLSGNIITLKNISGSVEIDPKIYGKSWKCPMPGSFALEPELRPDPNSGLAALPSIYDDLKNYNNQTGANRRRKREGKADRHFDRIRFEAKRRIKSEGTAEEPKNGENLSPQLNALLSPGYDAETLKPGSLKKNQFLYVAENLNADLKVYEKYVKKE